MSFQDVMERFRDWELMDFADMIKMAKFALGRNVTDFEARDIEDLWHNKTIDKHQAAMLTTA